RTAIFTDPAADAPAALNVRYFDLDHTAVNSGKTSLFKVDSLVGQRAHFLANDTVGMVGPGNAAILVDIGLADHLGAFLVQAHGRDSHHRADLTASVAGEIAVPQPRDQHRGPQPFHTGLSQGGLQGIGRASPHAYSTAQAARKQVILKAARWAQ